MSTTQSKRLSYDFVPIFFSVQTETVLNSIYNKIMYHFYLEFKKKIYFHIHIHI